MNIVDDCLTSKSPSIGKIIRGKGDVFTKAFLCAWLMNLNEILNLNKPMSEAQIELCVLEVVNSYSSFKIADLTLLFKRIIAGEFGEYYESLSIPKVLSFFRAYNEERMKRAYDINLSKHNDIKSDESFNISKNVKRIWKGTPSK